MDLLDKMATFVRVVEAGSFSAAAKQLRISPAAVSRQIATLEAQVRAPLLARSTRRMAITAVGRRYYESCLRVLRETDQAIRDAQAAGGKGDLDGPVQISAPVTFGLARVVPHVHALMLKHPRLRVDLRLEDRLIDLALEGVDVAIRVGSTPLGSADLIAHPLFTFRRVLVASPAYLRRRGEPGTPEALAKHDTLAYPGDAWTLANAERQARVRIDVVFRCNALHAVRDLAIAGAGIALLPDWLVAGEVRSRKLRRVLPSWQTTPVGVNAIHRTELRGAPRVRALIDHLRSSYAEVDAPRSS
jgi:DNA-binding transcriptional LysR family regulator